jgi:hypothetical protein
MDASLLAALNDAERLLVAQTRALGARRQAGRDSR